MLHELAALIGLLTAAGPGPETAPTVEARAFEGWFRSAERGELEIPGPVALRGGSFRYVFVGGYRNERMPGYFAQNIAELRALGVPRKAIHVINPSSYRTSEQNASEVRDRFLEIAEGGPEKLVVIAHSRGACDALAFAISHAPFVRDRVEALFLIQGPFGGSGAAEYAVGRGEPMDCRMRWPHRVLGNLAGQAVRFMARRSGLEVLEGMTRDASRAFWAKAMADHAGAIAVVGPKTFYVRSVVEPSRLRFVRRAIASYLQIYHGPSDGLVAVADQMVAGLGTVVATLEAGHGDLTHRFPATRAPRAMRRALVRSIVMAVGQAPASVATGEAPSSPAAGPGLDLRERPIPEGQPGVQGHPRREPGVSPPARVVAAGS